MIFVTAASAKISLIWQADRKHMWEGDWVIELLSGLDYESVDDLKFEKYIDNSVIVVSCCQESTMAPYFKKLYDMNYKFGIILLSDELYHCGTKFYQYAKFIFRNLWHKKFNNYPNVYCFPLGYKSGFWKGTNQEIKPALERHYTWSFAGQITKKPSRAQMIECLKAIPTYYIHEIPIFGAASSLGVSDYQNLLLDTIFVPCARGYWNMESFRLYEALECGCIPIVETFPINYYKKFLGEHPFITLDSSWQEAPAKMNELLQNPQALEQKRQECMQWWADYKMNLKKKFHDIIHYNLK